MSFTPLETPVKIDYTNYRGERSWRTVLVRKFWLGSTDFHPGFTLLMKAFDVNKGVERDFAVKDIHEWQI